MNKHAFDFSIKPSFKILRLLSFKVLPLDVMSVITSDEPINGQVSVAPRLEINLYCVTPFEIRKLFVKLGYFVATLNLEFLLILMSKATSSKSAIV